MLQDNTQSIPTSIAQKSVKMSSLLENVTPTPCLKAMLFLFNISLWFTGLLMLLGGLWAGFDLMKYMELSADFSGTAPYVLIGISMLILTVSSIAFPCIIKGQPVLLYIYSAFLACVCVMDAGLSGSIACYRDTLAKGLYDGLSKSIANYQILKARFDFAQTNLRCCGVSNYTDWVKTSPQKVIPISCCFNPSSCVTANYNEVYQQGCYEVITKYLGNNVDLLIGLAVASALYPLMGTVISCGLASYIKKSKYDAMA